MKWQVESKIAKHIECLKDKAGIFMGYIIRFNDNEPTFAWHPHGLIGSVMGDGRAKDLVEKNARTRK
jgi:hypothetical protein